MPSSSRRRHRVANLIRLDQPAAHDAAVRRVGAKHPARARVRRRIAGRLLTAALLLVDEHRPDLVIRTGIGACLPRPAA